MRLNVAPRSAAVTHEGGTASSHIKPAQALARAVATCLLWEPTFYEKGEDIAAEIARLVPLVDPVEVARIAVEARSEHHLRHVPLFLARQLVRHPKAKGALVGDTIAAVIQRPDELAEFVSLYWNDNGGKKALAAQAKRGLAMAFQKFDAYRLGKWNRDGKIKLRDVLFLCHAKPKDVEQEALWRQLVTNTLPVPDTWEVALSSGADKRETWVRLLSDRKLGYMALLANLRNMEEAGVEPSLVESALRLGAARSKALPFRFVSAVKAAPRYAQALSDAMTSAITEKLDGDTIVVLDVSGSMDDKLSAKSTLSRMDAAGALGVLLREQAPSCRIFTFSQALVEVPNYRGLPLIQAVAQSQQHGGTYLRQALDVLRGKTEAHRLIVVTDEQTHDGIAMPWTKFAYIINVAPYKPGLLTDGGWVRINGWSDRVVDWIRLHESTATEM